MFTGNIKNIVLFSCILSSLIFAREQEPSKNLAAYSNKISQISYSVGSHDHHAITFLCQKDPICMYTPLNYEQLHGKSLTKTYFLPRTQCADSQMRYFYEDLQESFKEIGIDLCIDEIKDTNYGLRMSFTMQSEDAYDIVKVIHDHNKTVTFTIVGKI